MVSCCCAYNCTEKFVKGGPLTFHRFPRDKERKEIWTKSIRRENFKPTDSSIICSKHFTPDCFDENRLGGTWLKSDAVPTIFDLTQQLEVKTADTRNKRNKHGAVKAEEIAPTPNKRLKYVGDFSEEDLASPTTSKLALTLADTELKKKARIIKSLRQRERRLENKVKNYQKLIGCLEGKTLTTKNTQGILELSEMDHQLIELVRMRPVLYAVQYRLTSNKRSPEREKAWEEISSFLGKTINECKTRWRTIRDSYKKHKKKSLSSQNNGGTFHSSSKYEELPLEFLDEQIFPVSPNYSDIITPCIEEPDGSGSHASDEDLASPLSLQIEIKQEFPDVPVPIDTSNIKQEIEELNEVVSWLPNKDQAITNFPTILSVGPLSVPTTSETISSRKVDKKPKRKILPKPVRISKRLCSEKPVYDVSEDADNSEAEEGVNVVPTRSQQQKSVEVSSSESSTQKSDIVSEHPIQTFFRSMASTVMTFPPQLIAETRARVCNIVSSMELQALRGNNVE